MISTHCRMIAKKAKWIWLYRRDDDKCENVVANPRSPDPRTRLPISMEISDLTGTWPYADLPANIRLGRDCFL